MLDLKKRALGFLGFKHLSQILKKVNGAFFFFFCILHFLFVSNWNDNIIISTGSSGILICRRQWKLWSQKLPNLGLSYNPLNITTFAVQKKSFNVKKLFHSINKRDIFFLFSLCAITPPSTFNETTQQPEPLDQQQVTASNINPSSQHTKLKSKMEDWKETKTSSMGNLRCLIFVSLAVNKNRTAKFNHL